MPSGLPLCQDPDQADLCEVPDADLDSLHVIQWERDIIWDDPDDSDSATEPRGDAQNGAAAPADDWDDLDRALEMDVDPPRGIAKAWQRPLPVLEPLPCRPARGGFCFQHNLPSQIHTINQQFAPAGAELSSVYLQLVCLCKKQRQDHSVLRLYIAGRHRLWG